MFDVQSIATAKLSEVRQFCADNNIVPTGDKRLLQTWRDAATAWFNAAVEVATSEPVKEAVATVKEASIEVTKKVWSIVSSDKAKHLYFMALVYTCVALPLVWRMVAAGARYAWSKRYVSSLIRHSRQIKTLRFFEPDSRL